MFKDSMLMKFRNCQAKVPIGCWQRRTLNPSIDGALSAAPINHSANTNIRIDIFTRIYSVRLAAVGSINI